MLDLMPKHSKQTSVLVLSRKGQDVSVMSPERVGAFAIFSWEIKSAPNIRERICGGQASITMGSC